MQGIYDRVCSVKESSLCKNTAYAPYNVPLRNLDLRQYLHPIPAVLYWALHSLCCFSLCNSLKFACFLPGLQSMLDALRNHVTGKAMIRANLKTYRFFDNVRTACLYCKDAYRHISLVQVSHGYMA